MSDYRVFHTVLKDLTRRYGHAMQRYDQAMYRGETDRADDAMSEMQTIEQSVTIIQRPGVR